MLQMLESHHFRKEVRLVWLTPAHALSTIVDYLTKNQIESLFVVGTEDHFYDASKYSELKALPNVRVEVISAADHSLDVKDDVSASLRILQHTIDSIRSFLSSEGQLESTGP
jgi:predicted alpha/beta-hydrolase family hydrolase